MGDQALAIGLEQKPLVMALKEFGAKQLFETLELLTDSGLRQVQQRSGAGSAPRFHDGNEGAQQGDVDISAQASPLDNGIYCKT